MANVSVPLIEADKRDLAGRIRVMLGHDTPHLTATDEEAVARMRHDTIYWMSSAPSVPRVLALHPGSRKASCTEAGSIRRSGICKSLTSCMSGIYHDLNDIRQIAAHVQSLLWAHLGNLQRFCQP